MVKQNGRCPDNIRAAAAAPMVGGGPSKLVLGRPVGMSQERSGWMGLSTFLWGPRMCIGYRFALLEMKLFVALIIRQFVLAPNDDTRKLSTFFNIVLRPIVIDQVRGNDPNASCNSRGNDGHGSVPIHPKPTPASSNSKSDDAFWKHTGYAGQKPKTESTMESTCDDSETCDTGDTESPSMWALRAMQTLAVITPTPLMPYVKSLVKRCDEQISNANGRKLPQAPSPPGKYPYIAMPLRVNRYYRSPPSSTIFDEKRMS